MISVSEIRARAEEEAARAMQSASSEQATYVGLATRLAENMAVRDVEPGDLNHAMLLIEETASIDFDVPTISRTPPLRASKAVVKRIVGFSVRFLATQVTLLGDSLVTFGNAVKLRIEGLEEQSQVTESRIAELERRIAALEAAAGDK